MILLGGIPSQQETRGRAVKVTTGFSCGIVDESRFNENRQIFDGLALRLIAPFRFQMLPTY